MNKKILRWAIFVLTSLVPSFILASEAGHHAPHVNGAALSVFWVVPFFGILLSIAVFPLIAPRFWHHHFGKVSLFWAISLMIPFLLIQGYRVSLFEILHVGLLD
ncbi:MAG: sodium:proton antiporter, partial [Simkaniaceae bacterium]|nr:sodium:proton antiporter [Simkaniaceae bacterium]